MHQEEIKRGRKMENCLSECSASFISVETVSQRSRIEFLHLQYSFHSDNTQYFGY